MNHSPVDYVCPFCLILRGIENQFVITRQCDVIYRSAATIAFVSSNQIPSRGANVLIIPTAHYENLYTLPDGFGRAFHHTRQLVGRAMKTVYGCTGISTRQHNEPNGNQDVWHYHEHITPRFRHDLLYPKMCVGLFRPMSADKRRAHALLLKEAIDKMW